MHKCVDGRVFGSQRRRRRSSSPSSPCLSSSPRHICFRKYISTYIKHIPTPSNQFSINYTQPWGMITFWNSRKWSWRLWNPFSWMIYKVCIFSTPLDRRYTARHSFEHTITATLPDSRHLLSLFLPLSLGRTPNRRSR